MFKECITLTKRKGYSGHLLDIWTANSILGSICQQFNSTTLNFPSMETGLPLTTIYTTFSLFLWMDNVKDDRGFYSRKIPQNKYIVTHTVFPESGGCTIILFHVARKTKMEQTPVNFDLVVRSWGLIHP